MLMTMWKKMQKTEITILSFEKYKIEGFGGRGTSASYDDACRMLQRI